MLLTYYLLGIIIIPGILLGIYAQIRVTKNFNEYKSIPARCGKSAHEVARAVLDQAGLGDVEIIRQSGSLTDHYNPSKRCIALSEDVYDSTSIASLNVALHEVGHAIQHQKHYVPLILRNIAIPVSNFASTLLWPLVIIGFLFGFGTATASPLANIFVYSGVIFFGLAVLVNLITLPVEFNASRRALNMLEGGEFLASDEMVGAKKVLGAAALTYVASLLVAILEFLRFLLVVFMSRNN